MTGYKSKKAAAQDKLAQPEQEPVVLRYADLLTTPPIAAVLMAELIAVLNEASENICSSARQPLKDELRGFALMLADAHGIKE
jgi:hypothetical protein